MSSCKHILQPSSFYPPQRSAAIKPLQCRSRPRRGFFESSFMSVVHIVSIPRASAFAICSVFGLLNDLCAQTNWKSICAFFVVTKCTSQHSHAHAHVEPIVACNKRYTRAPDTHTRIAYVISRTKTRRSIYARVRRPSLEG